MAKAKDFEKPVTETIVLGRDFRTMDFVGLVNWKVLDDLVGLGYLWNSGGNIELREKGQQDEKNWLKDPDRPAVRILPIAFPELKEVTGIFQEEKSVRAEVEFRWRYRWTSVGADLADFGDRSREQLKARYDPSNDHLATAELRKYDDGRRLDTIHFRQ